MVLLDSFARLDASISIEKEGNEELSKKNVIFIIHAEKAYIDTSLSTGSQ